MLNSNGWLELETAREKVRYRKSLHLGSPTRVQAFNRGCVVDVEVEGRRKKELKEMN